MLLERLSELVEKEHPLTAAARSGATARAANDRFKGHEIIENLLSEMSGDEIATEGANSARAVLPKGGPWIRGRDFHREQGRGRLIRGDWWVKCGGRHSRDVVRSRHGRRSPVPRRL